MEIDPKSMFSLTDFYPRRFTIFHETQKAMKPLSINGFSIFKKNIGGFKELGCFINNVLWESSPCLCSHSFTLNSFKMCLISILLHNLPIKTPHFTNGQTVT